MPRLANDRNELYAKHRAKGMIPKKAAIAAGYAQGSAIYSGLEDDPEVVTRIAELTHEFQSQREQQRAAALEQAKMVGVLTGVSKAWVIQKLAENAIAAKDDGDYGESNAALTLIGKEYGMFNGGSAIKEGDEARNQVVDMDQTEGLLAAAEGAMQPPAPSTPQPPIDMAMVERLIAGNRNTRERERAVTASERELTTGSETDVALTAAAEPDDPAYHDAPDDGM